MAWTIVESRLRPALTLDKPRIGGGSGPDLSPVPKNQKHVCRPWRQRGSAGVAACEAGHENQMLHHNRSICRGLPQIVY
jgi:hypothetical protein